MNQKHYCVAMGISNTTSERRSATDRRQMTYDHYVPDRRIQADRRTGHDRRQEQRQYKGPLEKRRIF